MPAPNVHDSAMGFGSASVSVSPAAKNLVALVGTVQNFTGGVAPTMNGSTVGRTLLGTTGSGFGTLWWYMFTGVPSGTVLFEASGRVIGATVYENAAPLMSTVSVNAAGWGTPSPSVGPNSVTVIFHTAAWTSDVASPQFGSTATGSVTLSEIEEFQYFDSYDWGLAMYQVVAASQTTTYTYVPSFVTAPTDNRISRIVLRYVDPAQTATLSRTTLGRIASFGATAIAGVRSVFNAGNWATSGATGSVSVTGTNLRVSTSTPNGFLYARLTTTDPFADGYMQAVWIGRLRTTDRGGILMRHVASPTIDYLRFGSNGGTQQIAQEVVNNTQVQGATASIAIAPTSRMHMKAVGTAMAGKAFTTAEGTLSGIGLTAAGYFGLMEFNNSINTSAYCDYSEFYACRSHLLTVNSPSLPTGWYMRILDAAESALATSAPAVAGVAQVDFYASQVALPSAVTIQVLDSTTNAVLASFIPEESLWGGDVWEFSTQGGGIAPARLVRRKAGAKQLLLKR